MSFLGPLKTQYDGIIWTTLNKSMGVFGRVDSSEDGQKVRETEEKFLEGVWLGGGEEKKWWGPGVFSWDLPENFLPKMRRKLLGKFDLLIWPKCTCVLSR